MKVRFGEAEMAHSGFTVDVSPSGIFIATSFLPKIGARIHVEVTLEAGKILYLEGVVARISTVPVELRTVVKSGFGVRFLTAAEVMGEMVPHLKSSIHVNFSFPSREALGEAVDKEVRNGALRVVTLVEYVSNSIVSMDIDLPFASAKVQLDGRIVQVSKRQDGKFETAVVFLDPQAALASLGALAGS